MIKVIHLLFLIFLIPGLQQEKYDIKLNLEKGNTYTHTIRTESDFLMMVNDQEMLTSTVFEVKIGYKVLEAQDTSFGLQIQFERISIKNKAPMFTLEYSSDTGDTTDMMSRILKEMVHKPFTATLGMNGNVSNLINIDTLYSSMWNGKAGKLLSSSSEMNKQFNDQLGEGVFKENLEMLSAFYPDMPVSIGESWSNATSLGKRLAGATTNNFSLIDVSDENFIIDGASEKYSKENDASMEIMGKKFQYDLDGGITFSCMMDYQSGWIEEAIIKQDFKGEIKMLADEAWNNRSIPIAISSVTTITK